MTNITRRNLLKAAAAAGIAGVGTRSNSASETAVQQPRPVDVELEALKRVSNINNPYNGSSGYWLRGDIHAHVNKSKSTSHEFDDGEHPHHVYRSANDAGLDFVCMSVDVTKEQGGVSCFGDVLSGSRHGVTGIPAREIQNNYYKNHFSEDTSTYLHVLTLGEAEGVSICAHPLYYEIANVKQGGSWAHIRKALLKPDAGGNLDRLKVSGLEVYNGFTRRRLKHAGKEQLYDQAFEEQCWDDMLKAGRLYWGYAGNDLFFGHHDEPCDFSPLGVVYVDVAEGQRQNDILSSLRAGRFYSSTGVKLHEHPIEAYGNSERLRIRVTAGSPVKWKATIHKKVDDRWELITVERPADSSANFAVIGDWRYVRIQCEDVTDTCRRAWLQPITNPRYFRL